MGKSYTPAPQDPDFERWWEHYPRKVNKGDARMAWWQTKSIRPSTDLLIRCLIVAKVSPGWLEDAGKWIPHASTYLRNEKWEDAPQVDLDGVKDGKVWWQSVAGVEAKAKEVGVEPRLGEDWHSLKNRILARKAA